MNWRRDSRDLTAGEMLQVVRLTRLGMSQPRTAEPLGISVATLRNWEQGRTEPDNAARTLIRLVYRHPQEIAAMLASDRAG